MPGGENRCFVVVNLYGGNDGLNCVVPHGDDRYYQLRPGLAVARSDVLAIDAHVGLNPMRSFKALYDKGMVAIVQGVGYPNPDHSHFRSTEIWQTAAPDRYEHTGWLGRYFDDRRGRCTRKSFQGRRRFASSSRSAGLESHRRSGDPGARRLSLVADRSAAARDAFAREAHDRSLPFESPYLAHVMEIENTRSAVPRNCRTSSPATRRRRRIRRPRSDAASRSPRRSSAAISERA